MPKSRPPAASADPGIADVDRYLEGVPEPARATLQRIREMIRAAVPEGTTEGISYRIPSFRRGGPLVGYAAFPNHCSLFVMSGSLLDRFPKELLKYETSKGTIRFSIDQPLPASLIRKLVKARIEEVESRKRR